MTNRLFLLHVALLVLGAILTGAGCRPGGSSHSLSRGSFIFGEDTICFVSVSPEVSSMWNVQWAKLLTELTRERLNARHVKTSDDTQSPLQSALALKLTLATQGGRTLPFLVLSGQGENLGAQNDPDAGFSSFTVKVIALRASSEVQADLRSVLDELLDDYFRDYTTWISTSHNS
jgi:hypothetical protein